jgi:hypothetical protein
MIKHAIENNVTQNMTTSDFMLLRWLMRLRETHKITPRNFWVAAAALLGIRPVEKIMSLNKPPVRKKYE